MPFEISNINITRASYKWACFVLIFIMATGIRVYRVSNKYDMNIDEAFSVALASCHNYGLTKAFDENKIYDGKTLRDSLLWNKSSLENVVNNLVQLHKDSRDLPHSNLYYSCLRLCFAGVVTSDLHRIIIQGFFLNLFFFLFSFIFLYKLARKLFDNYWLIVLTLVLAYFNPGSITNTLYLREYQLQEMLLVMLTYMCTDFYYKIKDGVFISTWQSMFKISILTSLVLLSGYFTTLYVVFLGLILLYTSLINKQKQNIPFLICSFCLSLALAGALYCKYFDGYFGYNGNSASALIHSISWIDNATSSFLKFFIDIRGYLLSLPALVLIGIIIIGILSKNQTFYSAIPYNKLPLILSFCAILWSLIIMFMLSWKGVYYFMSLFPIMILFIPFLVSYFKRKAIILIAMLFTVIFSIKAITRKEVYMGVLPVEKAYTDNNELPVIIAIEDNPSNLVLLSYFSDNRTFEFTKSPHQFTSKINKYKKLIVITGRGDFYKKQFLIPANYQICQQFSCNWYFDGYILQKK